MKKDAKKMKESSIPLYIWCTVVMLFLMLPILIIVPMSFGGSDFLEFPPSSFSLRWYKAMVEGEWMKGLLNSMKIAVGTVVLSVGLGTLAAIGIKNPKMKFGGIINIICLLPMMLPVVIIAVAMYLVYGSWKITGTFPAIILAHCCIAVPMVITMMTSALSNVDMRLYDAARSLGASHMEANIRVILPLVKPALFTSILFSFVTSFDESVISLFITDRTTITLPRMIFNSLRFEISPAISAISTVLIVVTVIIFIVNSFLERSK